MDLDKCRHERSRRRSFLKLAGNAAIGGGATYLAYQLYSIYIHKRSRDFHSEKSTLHDDENSANCIDDKVVKDRDSLITSASSFVSIPFLSGCVNWFTRGPDKTIKSPLSGNNSNLIINALFSTSFAIDFVPMLQKRIDGLCSDGSIAVKELKRRRRSQGLTGTNGVSECQMWDIIRKAEIRRLFLTYYGTTISGLILYVETHRIACIKKTDIYLKKEQRSIEFQRNILKFTYLRILDLTDKLGTKVGNIFQDPNCDLESSSPPDSKPNNGVADWNMADTKPLSFKEFRCKLMYMRECMEVSENPHFSFTAQDYHLDVLEKSSPLVASIISSYEDKSFSTNNEIDDIINETCDFLESPHFLHALTDCLNKVWDVFCCESVEKMFASRPILSDSEGSTEEVYAENYQKLPLAQIISKLKKCVGFFYGARGVPTIKMNVGQVHQTCDAKEKICTPFFLETINTLPSVKHLIKTVIV
uniref:Peroxisomal assembly protein PEX3 n=1 Tax=Corethron hystrix TaxID=216773 RepID=A0A7S1FKZ9_9STRA|mmetsp:Transcript_12852/g.28366  ORF Transcript_12852/g.28366 Transcript_12852/m.28366 type:complete len:474 (+) Transcript_12852:75-1496(+)